MKVNIKDALSLWDKKLLKNKQEPDAHQEEKPKKPSSGRKFSGSVDREKFEQAISYFKQRHGNGSKPAARIPESRAIDATAIEVEKEAREYESFPAISPIPSPDIVSDRVSADSPIVQHQTPVQEPAETFTQAPIQEMPHDTGRKQPGWVSPAYAQCRAVQLNPAHVAEHRCLAFMDNAPGAEAYRVLRTHVLQQTRDLGMNTIMITSALPREGKTVTAMNLSFSLAREFQNTVLLIDGDLRKQSIHKYLGYESDKGLMDYLTDGTPVSELIAWPGIEKMTIISGGRTIQESAELLGSPRMKELVAEIKDRYPDRYIIFDAPSILSGADALTLAPLVDRVIFVVQAGKTPLNEVMKAIQYLPKEKMLGFVMNRHSA